MRSTNAITKVKEGRTQEAEEDFDVPVTVFVLLGVLAAVASIKSTKNINYYKISN